MRANIQLALTRGSQITFREEDADIAPPSATVWPTISLRQLSKGLKQALESLLTGAFVDDLYGKAMKSEGFAGLMKWRKYVAKLNSHGLLTRTFFFDDQRIAAIEPISPWLEFSDVTSDTEVYGLSRFALLRADGDEFVLESPRGHAQIRLFHPVARAAVMNLIKPMTLEALVEATPGLELDAARYLMGFLLSSACVLDAKGLELERTDPAYRAWAFHDALFHARSRLGRKLEKGSGLDPFQGTIKPPPIVKTVRVQGEPVPLFRPNMMKLKSVDVPFAQVLESRGTVRTQGEKPITLQQLGEFLYRAARVRSLREDAGVSFRPYAGCGGIYALELYPLINKCEGLEPGLYHYDPLEHALSLISPPNGFTTAVSNLSSGIGLFNETPQVVFTITARFLRAQVKYASVAYASILKDLGALYQTMYLVAEAMSLAPVALGSGYPDVFAKAADLPFFEESSLGEFVLGSRAAPVMEVPKAKELETQAPSC